MQSLACRIYYLSVVNAGFLLQMQHLALVKRIFQLLYFLYATILFVVLLIPVFISSVIVSFGGAVRGGNLIYNICTAWADCWFFLVGIRASYIYEVPKNESEYIYVANHISYLDAALLVKAVRKPLRPLGKAELGDIPVFGFIYRRAVVMVDRSSSRKRAESIGRMKAVLRKGISILVFPEGTFNETHQPLKSFFDGAFRIAIETGTPIKPMLFLDTYERMPYDKTLSLNPGRCRIVFLEEIPVKEDDTATELRDRVAAQMKNAIIRYQPSWLNK